MSTKATSCGACGAPLAYLVPLCALCHDTCRELETEWSADDQSLIVAILRLRLRRADAEILNARIVANESPTIWRHLQ